VESILNTEHVDDVGTLKTQDCILNTVYTLRKQRLQILN
jgi:protein tyrosine phosphatase